MKYPGTDIEVPMPIHDWVMVKSASVTSKGDTPPQEVIMMRHIATDQLELFHIKRQGMIYHFDCKTDQKLSFWNRAAVEEQIKVWLQQDMWIMVTARSYLKSRTLAWVEGQNGRLVDFLYTVPHAPTRDNQMQALVKFMVGDEAMPYNGVGYPNVVFHQFVALSDLIITKVWKPDAEPTAKSKSDRLTKRDHAPL